MFETLEVGRRIKKDEFDSLELPLKQKLLAQQLELAEQDYPVIIVIAGLDGAGKGSLAQTLNTWMDPRAIDTNTYWEHSDEEESRPYFWRFWNKLPARGRIGIFLGSWYTRSSQAFANRDIDREDFAIACQQIESFERLLTDDGALVIKLWLHVSEETQRLQLQEKAPEKQQHRRITDRPYELVGNYQRTLEVSEKLILGTDSSHSPWHMIEAEDRRYRDITAGEIILDALTTQRHKKSPVIDSSEQAASARVSRGTVLDGVDLSNNLPRDKYKRKLADYQARLQDLAWEAYRQERSVVAVFEGWDAAGKGSAIRRVTASADPRLYKLVQFAAPTDEENAHHYLWRFWRRLQRDGRATLFDRSWYGRVLVERVEGFASTEEWSRAYSEINRFERQLVAHGCIVLKFWIHISPEEQLRRFKAREKEPHKRHKITEEDWRNREKWQDYELAVDQMVNQTSTAHAPWTLVAGNDKPFARIEILKTFCKRLEVELSTESN